MKNPDDGTAPRREKRALAELDKIASTMEQRFREGRRLLSFQQYLALFAGNPIRFGRDAARYVRDMFDHFGTRIVKKPWGDVTRYRLFDLPWDAGGSPADIAASGTAKGSRD